MIRLFKEPDDLYEIAWVELPENFASLDGDLLLSIIATSSRQGTIANRPSANLSSFLAQFQLAPAGLHFLGVHTCKRIDKMTRMHDHSVCADDTQACHPSVGSPVVSMNFGTWQEAPMIGRRVAASLRSTTVMYLLEGLYSVVMIPKTHASRAALLPLLYCEDTKKRKSR